MIYLSGGPCDTDLSGLSRVSARSTDDNDRILKFTSDHVPFIHIANFLITKLTH